VSRDGREVFGGKSLPSVALIGLIKRQVLSPGNECTRPTLGILNFYVSALVFFPYLYQTHSANKASIRVTRLDTCATVFFHLSATIHFDQVSIKPGEHILKCKFKCWSDCIFVWDAMLCITRNTNCDSAPLQPIMPI